MEEPLGTPIADETPLPAPPLTGILPLTVFYTVSLRGELRVLPYLFTLIKQQKATVGLSVLVDLGESCRMDWPICRVTEGRALLVAMDGMGYDGFHLSPDDPLARDAETQRKLRDTVLTAVLLPGQGKAITKKVVTGQPAEQYIKIALFGGDDSAETIAENPLQTGLRPGLPMIRLARGLPLAARIVDDVTVVIEDRREDRIPTLGRVDLLLDMRDGAAVALDLRDQRRIPIPAGAQAEPSISSLVEFVESEAQWAAKQRDG